MLGVQSPLKQPKPTAGVQTAKTPQEELLNYGWCDFAMQEAKYPEDLRRVTAGMTNDQAKVFRRGTDALEDFDPNGTKGYYGVRDHSVHLDMNKNDWESASHGYPNTNVSSLFHELSHAIDYNEGDVNRISKTPGLLDKIKEDALKWANDLLIDAEEEPLKDFSRISQPQKMVLNEWLWGDKTKYCNVSDIFEGLTNGRIGGWNNKQAGHGVDYWKDDPENIMIEFVAEAGHAWVMNEKGFQEVFGDAESGGALQMVIDEMRKRYAN